MIVAGVNPPSSLNNKYVFRIAIAYLETHTLLTPARVELLLIIGEMCAVFLVLILFAINRLRLSGNYFKTHELSKKTYRDCDR